MCKKNDLISSPKKMKSKNCYLFFNIYYIIIKTIFYILRKHSSTRIGIKEIKKNL